MSGPEPPHDPLLGACIAGKYDVTRVLGEGGFGAVYVAVQRPVGREVALKTIRPQHASNDELRQRFFREARVVASLTNDAIVTLFDYGETDDGLLYMVLELVRGRPLSEVLREHAPLGPERAVRLTLPILAALAEAHAAGLVHRDLKPDNVMVLVDSFGQEKVKVLDFGIAKVLESEQDSLSTRTGMVLGTPAYMSPEQAIGRGVGSASDFYAVGVMLYEMLAGVLPFRAPSAFELLTQHTTAPIPPLPPERGVPPALAAVVHQSLAKSPTERWPDAHAMARALDAAGGGRPSLNHGPPVDRGSTLGVAPTEAHPSAPSPTVAPAVSVAPTTDLTGERISIARPPGRSMRGLVVAAGLAVGLGAVSYVVTRDGPPPAPDAAAEAAAPVVIAPQAQDAAPPAPDAAPDAAPRDAAPPDALVDAAPPADPLAAAAAAAARGDDAAARALLEGVVKDGGWKARRAASRQPELKALAGRDPAVRALLAPPRRRTKPATPRTPTKRIPRL